MLQREKHVSTASTHPTGACSSPCETETGARGCMREVKHDTHVHHDESRETLESRETAPKKNDVDLRVPAKGGSGIREGAWR